MTRSTLLLIFATTVSLLFSAISPAAAFDHSHSAFTAVLKQHVKGPRFDYAALKSDPKGIESYLTSLAAVKESEFKGWSEKQQIFSGKRPPSTTSSTVSCGSTTASPASTSR